LGNPPINGVKFFAASDVLGLIDDRAWLAKATNAITQHWQQKNEKARHVEKPDLLSVGN
jgi:hypothetical protein